MGEGKGKHQQTLAKLVVVESSRRQQQQRQTESDKKKKEDSSLSFKDFLNVCEHTHKRSRKRKKERSGAIKLGLLVVQHTQASKQKTNKQANMAQVLAEQFNLLHQQQHKKASSLLKLHWEQANQPPANGQTDREQTRPVSNKTSKKALSCAELITYSLSLTLNWKK